MFSFTLKFQAWSELSIRLAGDTLHQRAVMFSKRDQEDGVETKKKTSFLSKVLKIYHMTEERDKEGAEK